MPLGKRSTSHLVRCHTKNNIQEISNSMKFADQSFFGRYFKKHTGMSPLQYRNEI